MKIKSVIPSVVLLVLMIFSVHSAIADWTVNLPLSGNQQTEYLSLRNSSVYGVIIRHTTVTNGFQGPTTFLWYSPEGRLMLDTRRLQLPEGFVIEEFNVLGPSICLIGLRRPGLEVKFDRMVQVGIDGKFQTFDFGPYPNEIEVLPPIFGLPKAVDCYYLLNGRVGALSRIDLPKVSLEHTNRAVLEVQSGTSSVGPWVRVSEVELPIVGQSQFYRLELKRH